MKLIRTLVCWLLHQGSVYEERCIEEHDNGLRIETVLVRECAICGRVLYRVEPRRLPQGKS